MPTQTILDLVALFRNKDFLRRPEMVAAGVQLDEELKLFVEREGKQPAREQMARAALAKTAPPPGKRQYNAPSQAAEERRMEILFLQRALLGLASPVALRYRYDRAARTLLVAWLVFDEGNLANLPRITRMQAVPWGEKINPFAESGVLGRLAVREETLWEEEIEPLIKRAMELLAVPPAVASAPPESEQQPAVAPPTTAAVASASGPPRSDQKRKGDLSRERVLAAYQPWEKEYKKTGNPVVRKVLLQSLKVGLKKSQLEYYLYELINSKKIVKIWKRPSE